MEQPLRRSVSSFNPTLVRLRRVLYYYLLIDVICFNPTLVRLRPRPSEAKGEINCLFQSHAGSIEAVVFAIVSDRDPQFQSHAGSIEAGSSIYCCRAAHMFQSHAGSIEAGRGTDPRATQQTFQSHAGSIEASPGPRKRPGSPLPFQSHAGSIEAGPSTQTMPEMWSFNPTLVRLRLERSWPAAWLGYTFQSHAGSIEAAALPYGGWTG